MNRYAFRVLTVGLILSMSPFARGQFTENDESLLYRIDAATGELQLLKDARIAGMKWYGSTDWSPDGSRIAFDATPFYGDWGASRILVYHVTGAKSGTIDDLGLGNGPSWSPDGARLVFFMNPGPQPGVWIMEANGSNRAFLGSGSRARWSPCGQYLLLPNRGERGHSYLLHDLISDQRTPIMNGKMHGTGQASWGPKGEQVAVVNSDGLGGYRIVVLNRNERYSVVHDIWRSGQEGLPADADPAQPIWHPNGKELLVRFGSQSQNWGWGRYYLVPLAGDKPPQPFVKFPHDGYRADASWEPNGKSVVFSYCRPAP